MSGKYVPPHLRNRPAAADPPPSGGSGFSGGSGGNSRMGDRRDFGWDNSSRGGDRGGYGGGRDGGRDDYSRGRDFGGDREERGPNPWGEGRSRGGFSGNDRMSGVFGGGGREKSEAEWNRLEKELFGEAKSAGIAFEKYDDIPAETSGNNIPPPIDSFSDETIHTTVHANIQRAKYDHPTPVQKHSVPIVCAGRDLMSCAQTGSGNTAAFLVPIISHLLHNPPPPQSYGGLRSRTCPAALVMSPTRELSTQIFDEARKFTFRTAIRPTVAYGGANIRDQISELRRGCDVLIATPGRLVDLMERGHVSLASIRYLRLDEADRMLDMGFEPQIRRIVEQADMPVEGRQTLMFSATFPIEIQRLAGDFLDDYVFLAVGRVGSTTDNITQRVELVEEQDKHSVLLDILTGVEGLTLIFVETKRMADQLEYFLEREGFPATSIHGDRSQMEREDALRTFKNGTTPYIVATDVASRGLDIPNVAHVVNFDLPNDIDSYVHRIGRTGRAGNTGIATSFVNYSHANIARDLLELLSESGQEVPPWLEQLSARGRGGFGGRSGGGRSGKGSRYGARDVRRDDRGGGSFQTRSYDHGSGGMSGGSGGMSGGRSGGDWGRGGGSSAPRGGGGSSGGSSAYWD